MKHSATPAKKALGQHFLHDRHAIERIVGIIPEGARILEIGPGPGALTRPLLARAEALAVIEKDDRFASQWQAKAMAGAPLSVFHDDVMQILPQAVAEFQPQWIAGNLPYNISGPLTALLAGLELSGGMVLMYQKEVAQRICAAPGSKVYGGLSVLVRHYYEPSMLLTLAPGAFSPPPKVHSAVVLLTPHRHPAPCPYRALQKTVRHGFLHRRKTIGNNFKQQLDAAQWQHLGISPRLRPEQLDYAAWARLAGWLNEQA